FFLQCSGVRRYLHSFPTRRSSDLRLIAFRFDSAIRSMVAPKRPSSVSGDSLSESSSIASAVSVNVSFGWGATLAASVTMARRPRSEEHTSELQSRENLVCRLLLEK